MDYRKYGDTVYLRVDKGDSLRLQVETVSLPSIEFIAHNRTTQPIAMGAVHPQLVGSPGMGPERQERELRSAKDPVFSDGALAVLIIHHLTGTVHRITQ